MRGAIRTTGRVWHQNKVAHKLLVKSKIGRHQGGKLLGKHSYRKVRYVVFGGKHMVSDHER